jgi:DNA-directed RNA polymerase specialized sigma24 family protein
MQTDPDASLVTQDLAGDLDALDALVRRHQSWIFNLALRIIWRRDLAED